MNWELHQVNWPMAETSRFVHSMPHKWHVQEMGKGPLLLLLHGAGSATQSWRNLMPLLARAFTVIAIDLPGQGFTRRGARQRCGLGAMAEDIGKLCEQENWRPIAVVGHSAGAAIALQLARDMSPPPCVVGINAALGHFRGLAGILFPLMAKALAMTPWAAHVFAASASRPRSVSRLIEGTGSQLSPEEMRWYRALVSDPEHVDGTLGMMAQWDLDPLLRNVSSHPSETLLIAGDQDKAVPPNTSVRIANTMPKGTSRIVPGLGHLAHEEDAEQIAKIICAFLNQRTHP